MTDVPDPRFGDDGERQAEIMEQRLLYTAGLAGLGIHEFRLPFQLDRKPNEPLLCLAKSLVQGSERMKSAFGVAGDCPDDLQCGATGDLAPASLTVVCF